LKQVFQRKEVSKSQVEEEKGGGLFSHMFSNTPPENIEEVKSGPRLYIQGIPTSWSDVIFIEFISSKGKKLDLNQQNFCKF